MNDITTAISALLTQAGQAHHEYEQTILKGVYDRDWSLWYAQYVLESGLNQLLARSLSAEQLAQLLFLLNQQYQAEHSPLNWAEYTAQKLTAS